MRFRMLITISILILATQTAMTQTTPLRVLASNGMKAVVEELQQRLEREVARPLAIEFNTSTATRQRIESGEAFDVAILTTEVVNELSKAGKIASGSVVDLERETVAGAILLGRLRTAGRVEITMSAAISQKKG